MKSTVLTVNQIEGFHRWNDAPKYLSYLAEKHRHIFCIECEFSVDHNDREIEIITEQNIIEEFIRDKYGKPAQFGNMSCEDIAADILNFFSKCISCTVREDGYGGGRAQRR